MKQYTWLLLVIVVFFACESKESAGKYDHLDQRTRIRLRQYMVEGKRLYGLHCANCHQLNGEGLARLYPPLKNSDYLKQNKQEAICGIRYGQKGEIFVNGVMFNQEMPGIKGISDLEIAEIATYIYTEFADTVQIITLHQVKEILSLCQGDTLIVPELN